jgi:hypothetical protein
VRRPRGKISRDPVAASAWPQNPSAVAAFSPTAGSRARRDCCRSGSAATVTPKLARSARRACHRPKGHAGTARAGCDGGSWQAIRAGSVRTFHGPATDLPADLACTWRPGLDAGGRSNILVTCAFPLRVADVTCDGPQGGSSGVIRQARSLGRPHYEALKPLPRALAPRTHQLQPGMRVTSRRPLTQQFR